MEDIKVSVIVPIYNVEQFIARCAESLFNQTLKQVEYIFVNDATPDNSIEILKGVIAKYPNLKDRTIIINHEKNLGLPSARNTGLARANGDFIFHCDSDDYVEPLMLEDMYNAAISSNADIVWCDWYITYAHTERYMRQPSYATAMDALKGMLRGEMKFNVWNKLVRQTLYRDNNISFPDGQGMGEDMTMILLFVNAHNIAYLPKAYYHYVKLNTGAFSQTYSDQHLLELKNNVERVCRYISNAYVDELDAELAFLKLDVKFPFLITDDSSKHMLWREWYPDANSYIGKNTALSFRSNFLQRMAKCNQFWIVSLYYKIVYKLIYRAIYK